MFPLCFKPACICRAGFFLCYSKKGKTEAKLAHLFSLIKELECHILKIKLLLADRVSVLAKKYKEDPFRAEKVCRIIKSHKGTMFKPEIVDALLELSKRECFWFDLASNNLSGMVNRLRFKNVEIDSEDKNEPGLIQLKFFMIKLLLLRSFFINFE